MSLDLLCTAARPWRAVLFPLAALLGMGPVLGAEPTVKIAGFGTKTGVLRQFGANSEAAMRAAAEQINKAGGVRLADGTKARIEIEYFDDRCNSEEGVSLVRRFAASDWLAALGTTCSSVVESVYGVLQKKATPDDAGVRMPVFTDVAMKIGLTRASEWAFRNIPDEHRMYDTLFAWTRKHAPDAKTVYGGVEENFVHSNQTWYSVMKPKAAAAGYQLKGEAKWLVDDTNFAAQVRQMKEADADIVAISAHPFTACGVLKEMQRQGYKPKMLVGLTSISSPETLEVCGAQAQGLLVPTSFAPVTPKAEAASKATAHFGGYADLHSMAAWENMFTLVQAIEAAGLQARPDTVQADRARLRDALAALTETDGLIGTLQRTREREAVKPFVFVEARGDRWQVVYRPGS